MAINPSANSASNEAYNFVHITQDIWAKRAVPEHQRELEVVQERAKTFVDDLFAKAYRKQNSVA